jgi:kelch-like protein 2/3
VRESINPTHAVTLVTQLAKMYREGRGTDLAVVVGERRFEVHGCVMMCGSEFFRTQLQTGVGAGSIREMELPAMSEVTLLEMSARAFELIVECLYTGELRSIDDSNVMVLLEASKRLQVGVAEARCCEWLEGQLDVSNAMLVWESARRLGCERVQEQALPIVGRHLKALAVQEEFLALPQAPLVELLSSDSLEVRCEVTVYEAVMGWVRSDLDRRKGAIGEVLGAVRLGLLPGLYIAENVAADALIKSIDAAHPFATALGHLDATAHGYQALRNALPGSLLRRRNRAADSGLIVLGGGVDVQARREQELQQRMRRRREFKLGPPRSRYVPVIRKPDMVDGRARHTTVELYKPHTQPQGSDEEDQGTWGFLSNTGLTDCECAAVCMHGILYVAGAEGETMDNLGFEGADDNSRVISYDPSKQEWEALPNMSVSRSACAGACIRNVFYVVGGYNDGDDGDGDDGDGDDALATAECYDACTRQWRALPSMSVKRHGHAAAACVDGLLYVVGGKDENENILATAECFDPSTGQWRALPSMSVKRYGHAATCINGLLYVVGGTDNSELEEANLASAECYDTVSGRWQALPDMDHERIWCAAACMDGRLYVVGGEGGEHGEGNGTVERYDPSTGEWDEIGGMSVPRSGCAAVFLP